MPNQRILVVDDEKGVLDAWERALRLAGYSVSTAQTAELALKLCDEHLFDLIILDFIMPGIDGIELLRRIRKKLPLLRSIIVSGKIDEEASESDIGNVLRQRVEADLYLHKPVSNDRLKACVEELLRATSPKTWQDIAKRAGDAQRATIKGARQTSKELRRLLKKPKKKK